MINNPCAFFIETEPQITDPWAIFNITNWNRSSYYITYLLPGIYKYGINWDHYFNLTIDSAFIPSPQEIFINDYACTVRFIPLLCHPPVANAGENISMIYAGGLINQIFSWIGNIIVVTLGVFFTKNMYLDYKKNKK